MDPADYACLSSLPEDHPDRNRPLMGASFRVNAWHGEDLTVPFSERGENWKFRKWTPWKQVLPSWSIAQKTYNQLGPTWTDRHQWKFIRVQPKPKPKPKE